MIPFYGYNYIKLFELLTADPGVPLNSIARNICTHFPAKYLDEPLYSKTHDPLKPYLVEKASFSAIYPRCFDQIKFLIERISGFLLEKWDVVGKRCKLARLNILSPLDSQCVIDLRQFFLELSRFYNDDCLSYPDELREFHEALLQLRDEHMVSIVQPGVNFEGDIRKKIQICAATSPQFFSIFFPYWETENEFADHHILYGYEAARGNTNWITFVRRINGL
jgi:hypothetical protein